MALPATTAPSTSRRPTCSAFLERVRRGGFAGGNVTIPHKEAVFEAVDRRDAAAGAIGAVNTLWLDNGELVGGNTDAYGFAANLDADAPDWRAAETALVLGAGGAARAVLHALREAGIGKVTVANRSAARAGELALAFPGVKPAGSRSGAGVACEDRSSRQHDVARHEGPAAARSRPRRAPGPRDRHRHRLCAA